MKKYALPVAIFFSMISLVSAKEVSLDNGNITFDAPENFEPIPQEIIEIKYPLSQRPRYVVGNESASTTIAYDLKPHNIPQDEIDEALEAFSQMFPKIIPGLQWKEIKIIELSGRKWGYMEMTSTAIDTDIYNIMLFTGYDNQMLIFNFNSTREDFSKYEQPLRNSLKSIRIKQ
ncbi:MAG: hypothetical protein AAGF26_10690 [Cyanobacteria bacterium P01_G01_bin.49]